jgi:hypothetical protein
MNRRCATRLVAALAAVVLSPVVAACGDDDNDGDRLSEADFLEQGNQICAGSNARIQRAGEEAFGSADGDTDPEALTTYLAVLKAEVRGQIDDVTALRPPSNLEDELTLLKSTANEEFDQMVADIDADPTAFAYSEADPFAESNAIMVEIGLKECSG